MGRVECRAQSKYYVESERPDCPLNAPSAIRIIHVELSAPRSISTSHLRINLTILSAVSVSILPVVIHINNRRYSYDTTAAKNDRVSPTQGPLGTYSGELRPGRASTGGALSQIPRLDL